MRRYNLAFVIAVLAAAPLAAAEPLPPELALIPKDAAAFVSVRYDRLNASPLGKAPVFADLLRFELLDKVEKYWLGFPLTEIERVTAVFPAVSGRFTVEDFPLLVFTRTKKIDRAALLATVKDVPVDRSKERAVEERKQPARTSRIPSHGQPHAMNDLGMQLYFVGDRSFVLALGASPLAHLVGQYMDPSDDAPLTGAVTAAASKDVIVAGMSGPAIKNLLAAWPEKERELAILGDARSVTLRAAIDPDFALNLNVEFSDGASARRARPALVSLRNWAMDELQKTVRAMGKDEERFADLMVAALKEAGEPKLDGKNVTLAINMKRDTFVPAADAGLRSAVTRIIGNSADRQKVPNNLRQIAVGIHNLHDAYGHFLFNDRPQGALHAGLSWRVALLPFIGEEKLYKEFKLDEPWDSESNKKLVKKLPKLFAPPTGVPAKPGHTYLRIFDGPGTIGQAKSLLVPDGSSNTIMVVEAAESEIWTKPDELEYDPTKPLPKLGGYFADGFHVQFVDGSSRFIKHPADEKTLRAWITTNGNEDDPSGRQPKKD